MGNQQPNFTRIVIAYQKKQKLYFLVHRTMLMPQQAVTQAHRQGHRHSENTEYRKAHP